MSSIFVLENGKYIEYVPGSGACRDALIRKAKEIKSISFHTGDLSEKVRTDPASKADTLSFSIKHNRFDSPGTGTFTTSNLTDVLEWREERTADKVAQSRKLSLYCIDMGRYEDNLLEIINDDESWDYCIYLEDISKAVISQTPYTTPKNRMTIGKVYGTYKQTFLDFGISYSEFSNWARQMTQKINLADKENLRQMDSIATSFQKDFLHINGINVSKCYRDDSVVRGNIIFDLDKEAPYEIDFGDNIDLAKYFAELTTEKCLENKLDYVPKEDLDGMFKEYERQLPQGAEKRLREKSEEKAKKPREHLSLAERVALAKAKKAGTKPTPVPGKQLNQINTIKAF